MLILKTLFLWKKKHPSEASGASFDCGNNMPQQYLMLPKAVSSLGMSFVLDITDDSMSDAGILPGDSLRFQLALSAVEGDVVLALAGGVEVVRMYYRNHDGGEWLLACKAECPPIPCDPEADVTIIGIAIEHIRSRHIVPPHCCEACLRHFNHSRSEQSSRYGTDVSAVIARVAPTIAKRRQWYAVYRALVDCDILQQERFEAFVSLVQECVPDHPKLPTAEIMRRMSVQTFTRPVAQWDINNAPVNGIRFERYADIAQSVIRGLTR